MRQNWSYHAATVLNSKSILVRVSTLSQVLCLLEFSKSGNTIPFPRAVCVPGTDLCYETPEVSFFAEKLDEANDNRGSGQQLYILPAQTTDNPRSTTDSMLYPSTTNIGKLLNKFIKIFIEYFLNFTIDKGYSRKMNKSKKHPQKFDIHS